MRYRFSCPRCHDGPDALAIDATVSGTRRERYIEDVEVIETCHACGYAPSSERAADLVAEFYGED